MAWCARGPEGGGGRDRPAETGAMDEARRGRRRRWRACRLRVSRPRRAPAGAAGNQRRPARLAHARRQAVRGRVFRQRQVTAPRDRRTDGGRSRLRAANWPCRRTGGAEARDGNRARRPGRTLSARPSGGGRSRLRWLVPHGAGRGRRHVRFHRARRQCDRGRDRRHLGKGCLGGPADGQPAGDAAQPGAICRQRSRRSHPGHQRPARQIRPPAAGPSPRSSMASSTPAAGISIT